MNSKTEIIEACGGVLAVATALPIKPERIRNVLCDTKAKLPASWFDAMERLAGCQLPREHFTFKGL
jgi:hypothetical protein